LSIDEAARRGLLSEEEALKLKEASKPPFDEMSKSLDTKSGTVTDPRSGEQISIDEAVRRGLLTQDEAELLRGKLQVTESMRAESVSTYDEFVSKGDTVRDASEDIERSGSGDAFAVGIAPGSPQSDKPSETFADPESVACLSDSNAAHSGTYSVKCSSELASSIAETVHSSKNVAVSEDYKTQTYREQAVAEVQAIGFSPVLLFFDTISGQQLKFSDCLDMGLIDLNNSCLVDPVTRIELPLLDALERNVVDRESGDLIEHKSLHLPSMSFSQALRSGFLKLQLDVSQIKGPGHREVPTNASDLLSAISANQSLSVSQNQIAGISASGDKAGTESKVGSETVADLQTRNSFQLDALSQQQKTDAGKAEQVSEAATSLSTDALVEEGETSSHEVRETAQMQPDTDADAHQHQRSHRSSLQDSPTESSNLERPTGASPSSNDSKAGSDSPKDVSELPKDLTSIKESDSTLYTLNADKDFTVVDSDAVEQPEISREEQDSEQLSAEKAAANSSDSAAEDFGKSEESGIVKTSEEQSEASQRQQLVLESGLTRLDQDESSQATKDAHKESSNAGDSISIASSTEITDSNKKDDSELFGRPNIKDSENREVDELDEPKFSFEVTKILHWTLCKVSMKIKLEFLKQLQIPVTSPSASDGDAGVSISKDTDTKGGSLDTDDRAYSQTVRRMSAASMEQNSLSSLAIQHLSHASHEFHGQKLDPGQFPVGFSTQPVQSISDYSDQQYSQKSTSRRTDQIQAPNPPTPTSKSFLSSPSLIRTSEKNNIETDKDNQPATVTYSETLVLAVQLKPIKHHEVSPTEAEAAESRPSEERQEQLNPEAKELELRADKESREAPKPEEAVKQAEVRDEVAPTDAQAAESR
uniref:Glutaredoxin domain-containing protein n=1 Tax=Macrostomum lignano TaxID=282301 RepID=A0A1I8FZ57_9PLAT